MIKIISLFSVTLILLSCNNHKKIDSNDIRIIVENNIFFQGDHSRQLIINNNLDTIRLVSTNDSCEGHLFKENNNYILIDCNGCWYEISSYDGRLLSNEWKWQQDFPEQYLGVYECDFNRGEYIFRKLTLKPNLSDVYKIKDPDCMR